jgi:hypothetical protein
MSSSRKFSMADSRLLLAEMRILTKALQAAPRYILDNVYAENCYSHSEIYGSVGHFPRSEARQEIKRHSEQSTSIDKLPMTRPRARDVLRNAQVG